SNTTGLNPSTQYFYRVRATNGVGPSDNSNTADATTQAAPALPSPWVQGDIGTNAVSGSASFSSGTFTINGSGTDIAGTADGFHYVYQPWSGNGQIIVRVGSIQNTNSGAKAGVMFRETLDANSKEASLCIMPANGVVFTRRTTTGGS